MSILLRSDRLKVEIAEPGLFPNVTTRFDRAGFVTQVTLDGRHQVLQPRARQPSASVQRRLGAMQ